MSDEAFEDCGSIELGGRALISPLSNERRSRQRSLQTLESKHAQASEGSPAEAFRG